MRALTPLWRGALRGKHPQNDGDTEEKTMKKAEGMMFQVLQPQEANSSQQDQQQCVPQQGKQCDDQQQCGFCSDCGAKHSRASISA